MRGPGAGAGCWGLVLGPGAGAGCWGRMLGPGAPFSSTGIKINLAALIYFRRLHFTVCGFSDFVCLHKEWRH